MVGNLKKIVILVFLLISLNLHYCQIYAKNNDFKTLKTININNKIYRFGMKCDNHGDFGIYQKYTVIDKNNKEVFSNEESTWNHSIDGYYIGNLTEDNNPEIVCWHRDVVGLGKSNMIANFYKFNKSKNQYEPYWKDYTDDEFSPNESNKIIKALLGKNSKYEKAFKIAQEYNPNISILNGYKPDNRAMEYIFISPDKNPKNQVIIYLDKKGKIYVKPGSEPHGRIDIEKYLYKKR